MCDSGVMLWGEIRCLSLLGVKGLNINDDDHDQNALVHFTTLCKETCIEPFSKFLRRYVADAPNLEIFGNKVTL